MAIVSQIICTRSRNSVHALAEVFLNSIGHSDRVLLRSKLGHLVSCVSVAILEVGIVSRSSLLKYNVCKSDSLQARHDTNTA